ncbi:hypothetical protein P3342_002207 [Pyrenophora teres f. teres]|nr:hypothetical protein P3342_002207 [Pyrenophora teres f. teres]
MDGPLEQSLMDNGRFSGKPDGITQPFAAPSDWMGNSYDSSGRGHLPASIELTDVSLPIVFPGSARLSFRGSSMAVAVKVGSTRVSATAGQRLPTGHADEQK